MMQSQALSDRLYMEMNEECWFDVTSLCFALYSKIMSRQLWRSSRLHLRMATVTNELKCKCERPCVWPQLKGIKVQNVTFLEIRINPIWGFIMGPIHIYSRYRCCATCVHAHRSLPLDTALQVINELRKQQTKRQNPQSWFCSCGRSIFSGRNVLSLIQVTFSVSADRRLPQPFKQ